jgi:hypothetical protein
MKHIQQYFIPPVMDYFIAAYLNRAIGEGDYLYYFLLDFFSHLWYIADFVGHVLSSLKSMLLMN